MLKEQADHAVADIPDEAGRGADPCQRAGPCQLWAYPQHCQPSSWAMSQSPDLWTACPGTHAPKNVWGLVRKTCSFHFLCACAWFIISRWQKWLFPLVCCIPYLAILVWLLTVRGLILGRVRCFWRPCSWECRARLSLTPSGWHAGKFQKLQLPGPPRSSSSIRNDPRASSFPSNLLDPWLAYAERSSRDVPSPGFGSQLPEDLRPSLWSPTRWRIHKAARAAARSSIRVRSGSDKLYATPSVSGFKTGSRLPWPLKAAVVNFLVFAAELPTHPETPRHIFLAGCTRMTSRCTKAVHRQRQHRRHRTSRYTFPSQAQQAPSTQLPQPDAGSFPATLQEVVANRGQL